MRDAPDISFKISLINMTKLIYICKGLIFFIKKFFSKKENRTKKHGKKLLCVAMKRLHTKNDITVLSRTTQMTTNNAKKKISTDMSSDQT